MKNKNGNNTVTRWLLAHPVLSSMIISCVLLITVTCIIVQRYYLIQENERREMSTILRVVHQNIDQALKNSYTAALTLALTVDDEGKPQNFEAIAKQLTDTNPGVDGVQLVPNGIISYVHPYHEHKAALGLNILTTSETSAEARKAIKQRKMYFAGPLPLRQGGLGLIGRLPVYQDNKFWGFSAVVVKLETLLNVSGINSVANRNYFFQISKVNPSTGVEEFFLPTKTDFGGHYYETMTVTDSDLKLYIVTKNNNDVYAQILPLALLGLLYIVLFGFLITLLLRKPAELQITVDKQATILQKSEMQFRKLFEYAPIGIGHIDTLTGKIIDVNGHYCRITGYTRDELIGANVIDLNNAVETEETASLLKSLIDGEIPGFTQEKKIDAKLGEKWVRLAVSPLWEPGEKPTTHIAIIEDISGEYQAKEQIHKSEARFKSLFEDSPIALWEEDFSEVAKFLESRGLIGQKPKVVLAHFADHPEDVQHCVGLVRIIDVNNECLKLHYPRTREQLISEKLNAIVDEESSKAFIKQLVAITSGSQQIAMETTAIRDNGEICDIHLRWNVMRGYEQTLERVIVSTEDITAQKNAERMLVKSRRELETLIDTVDGIVWESDYNTYEFTFVNKQAQIITGYPVEEWLGDGSFWARTIHPDDRPWALDFCATSSSRQSRYDFEYRMIAKNGDILWIRDIVNVVHENGKPVKLRGIMIDITQAKEAEKSLQESLELVTEQNKRLHNFSYIVGHNLRSHTANIQSIVNLIEQADSEEERRELIEMMKTVSGSLNETMLHLNDLLNIQSKVALVSENLDLNQYIDNTMNVLAEQISTKGVEIIREVPPGVKVDYNPAYLDSILLNLVSNAIRYSDPSRKPIIRISWLEDDEQKILKISDNGIGIDLAKHGEKLFGMYKTFNGNADARGIGLFITRNQIEAMGGSISVESTFGKGTSFLITFR